VPPLDIVVGLGGNVGDRLGQLRSAVRDLASQHDVRARSWVYETAPVGPPQPDYLNAAVRLRADGTVEALLASLLEIERRGGRVRTPDTRWGPRTIDLDLLWVDGLVLATPSLTVPHPHLLERAFALRPLHDVAPNAIDPRTGALFPEAPSDASVRRTEHAL
jgi:2-amino-4-hydroxy-6-hydroxymethyldihydropteridine diphosphokinase